MIFLSIALAILGLILLADAIYWCERAKKWEKKSGEWEKKAGDWEAATEKAVEQTGDWEAVANKLTEICKDWRNMAEKTAGQRDEFEKLCEISTETSKELLGMANRVPPPSEN